MTPPTALITGIVVLALAAASVTSCGSDDETTATPASSQDPPAIHAEIRRSRLFETQRQLKLVLRDDGDTEIVVDSLRLDSPLLTEVPAQQRRSVLQPGRAVSIPVDFGESVCDQETDQDSFVVLGIGGETHRILLDQPTDALAGLNDRDCETVRIFEAFDLRWGDDVVPAGEFAVQTTLELDRREAGHSLQVDEVRGSVVINLEAVTGGLPTIGLDDDEDHASVDVIFNASRCDSHALTESKKTFVFASFIHLDGGPAVKVELPAEGTLREVLGEFIEACH